MTYDRDEFEKRLEIARQRGATPQQIQAKRVQYQGQLKKKEPFLVRAGKAIADPAIKAGKDLVGGTIAAASGVGEIAQRLTVDPNNENKRFDRGIQRGLNIMTPEGRKAAVSTNSIEPLKVGAQRGLGVASYLVPGGKTAKGAIGLGAASGALRGASENADSLEQFAGQTFAGGVGGAAGGGIAFGAGKALQSAGGKLASKSAGRNVNPQVASGPKSIVNEKQLQQVADNLGLKGGPNAKRTQIAQIFDDLNTQIDDVLVRSDAAITVDDGVGALRSNVIDYGTYYVPGDKAYNKLLERELSRLSKSADDGVISVDKLFKFKKDLSGSLNNAFRKEQGSLGSALSMREQVQMDLWRNIDDLITNLEPSVKAATTQQSKLYQLAPGLEKLSKETYNVPIINTKIPTAPFRAATDAAGRGVQNIGKGMGTTGRMLSKASGGAGQLVGRQAGANLALGGQEQPLSLPPVQNTGVNEQLNQPSGQIITPSQAQLLVRGGQSVNDKWIVHPDGKQIWNPNTQGWMAYNAKAFGGAAGGGNAEGDTARAMVDRLKGLYGQVQQQGLTASSAGPRRFLEGIRGSTASVLQTSPEAAAYSATQESYLTMIARAAGEKGTLTDQDIKRIQQALPKFSDSPATASQKWQSLDVLLKDMENKIGAPQGTLSTGGIY